MSGNPHVDVMLAGAAAAFTVDLLIYPLDTLKTRQQSRDFVRTFADPSARTRLPSPHLFRGLYQGIGIVVVATLPAAGTFFTTYEAAKTFLGRHASSSSSSSDANSSSSLVIPQAAVHSAASALAECASCLVLTPAEVIKQNAQMVRSREEGHRSARQDYPSKKKKNLAYLQRSTSLQALRQLGGAGAGVAARRLLSGYSALVARNLPFTAIQFPIFEAVRERIWTVRRRSSSGSSPTRNHSRSLLETGLVTGASAGLAGSFAALVTTPMDVVKTRMMLDVGSSSSGSSNGSGDEKKKKDAQQGAHERGEEKKIQKQQQHHSSSSRSSRSALVVARQVIADRGVAGLFRGGVLRAVWTAVGSGLYLGMYEVAKVWLTGDEKEARGKDDRGSFP